MSYYVFGSKMSYKDYLTGKSFVADMTSATHSVRKSVTMALSRQTREVIASNETLARDQIRSMEVSVDRIAGAMGEGFQNLTGAMNAGFEQLSYGMEEISAGISELNATFHWGFGEMIAALGHMNDALSELIKIAKTPVQTVAFNHFEIARDAFRQSLYLECLEELDKAISGDHTSTGYKMEWRFHQMKGTLQLGFAGGDLTLLDLSGAEQSFLLAARYARSDYPGDAARAFLSAGWAAYCQGKMPDALAHTEQAIGLHPRMGEAFFQAAKVRMAMGEVDKALSVLGKAIDLDRFYALKAAGDGDFQPHDDMLRVFLEALRKEKYRQSVPKVKEALGKLGLWRDYSPEAWSSPAMKRIHDFLEKGENLSLMDMLGVVQGLDKEIAKIRSYPLVIVLKGAESKLAREEAYPVEETYQEEVVIKKGGVFQKAVTEMQTRKRTVMKTHKVVETVPGKGIKMEFCPVAAGTFMMGDGNDKHPVTLIKDFLLGKYPVTQAQWDFVMGGNSSRFKGPDWPVGNVLWTDCQKYIDRLNTLEGRKIYRLPTEAEWEYACRAGSNTIFCFGNDADELKDYAWFSANSGYQTHPVGQKNPNAWGLHDMHGNVWEWCQDCYVEYPSGPVIDPEGPSSGTDNYLHTYRGGSGESSDRSCRSDSRNVFVTCDGSDFFGFRLLRTAY